ncbi:probable cytochrome-c oxidase, subunit II protein [Rhizobium etli CFN 42]|uniref:Cytochrome-c oxidase subunit 2 protein n=2 Tax=Rhizobium etli TaxID=29449 RepID=A0AAN1EJ53_RHIET|nr:cytochrome c oxidase subunit II [Rhizobium etli]ABC89794.1 probable cytochrome-c oxidase, subunit II protein [Rhizobium etli CFN 42]AGS20849.1 cytochrome-c oxidase subunit 2 protein [Rhizobium etli bv. mimosae str. Mim1]ARQ09088.1 cytochrome-c oxidase subunit 2 protein [Rhizobium etli]
MTEIHDEGATVAERVERRWAAVAVLIIVFLAGMAAFAGIHQATMPQTTVETIDPTTIHLQGEFVESNLGSAVGADGSVTVRAVGQQYSFSPPCLLVPSRTPITIRATSADVVHGLLVQGTNINTMLVPGYVSVQKATFSEPGEHLMPCQEFCSVGHEGMWGKVKVVDKQQFLSELADKRRISCAP